MIGNIDSVDNELIRYLNYCIDVELRKAESEMDLNLIDKYSVIIDHLENHRYDSDPKIKHRQIKELIKLYRQNKIAGVRRTLGKIVAAVLVFIGVAVGSLLTASAVTGISPIELLKTIGWKLIVYDRNESVTKDGLTYVKPSGAKNYGSIAELVAAEQIDILYPTWLPENVRIDKVIASECSDGKIITFIFNDDFLMYEVMLYDYYFYYISNLNDVNYFKTDINGIEVVYRDSNYGYSVFFEKEGYSYNVTNNAYDDLIMFITGLRDMEINK